jgi:8-oxo-dGTP diphosphatase
VAEVGGPLIGPAIRAAGGVLWRPASTPNGGGVEVAVIHRPRYDDWSLPKGKLAPGEPDLEGAVREVLEETGFHVRVGRPLGETRYVKSSAGVARPKVVRWWAMEAEEGAFVATREVDELRWLPLGEAEALLTRPSDRELLDAFARGPAPTRTVLLVRHAVAGTRATWSGDDRLRPLDECGSAQSDELTRHLARFDVTTIVSADLLRCTQTVAPLAEALALPILEEPFLSQVGYPGREAEAIALIRSLAADGRDGVACSQGEVIPDLLDRLATEDGYPIERPIRARKGSTWALSIDADNRLAAVDHIPAPRPDLCRPDA